MKTYKQILENTQSTFKRGDTVVFIPNSDYNPDRGKRGEFVAMRVLAVRGSAGDQELQVNDEFFPHPWYPSSEFVHWTKGKRY